MQQYKDQITVNVDRAPLQPLANLEAGSPAVGIACTGTQPTALKTAFLVGGICGLTGLVVGTVLGANQQNYQLDRAKADLVQAQDAAAIAQWHRQEQQVKINKFCQENGEKINGQN